MTTTPNERREPAPDVGNQFVTAENGMTLPGIDSRQGKLGGQPCLAGNRITVAQVIAQISEYGSVSAFADDFDLNEDEVKICLRSAASLFEQAYPRRKKPTTEVGSQSDETYIPDGYYIREDPDYGEMLVKNPADQKDRCPRCGEERIRRHDGCYGLFYGCGRAIYSNENEQVDRCQIRELEQTVANLTAERDDLRKQVEVAEVAERERDELGKIIEYNMLLTHMDTLRIGSELQKWRVSFNRRNGEVYWVTDADPERRNFPAVIDAIRAAQAAICP